MHSSSKAQLSPVSNGISKRIGYSLSSTPFPSSTPIVPNTLFTPPRISPLRHPPRYFLSNASPTRSPVTPVKTPRPIQKSSGPLLASTRFNVNLGTYTDSKSPGLSSRIVQYDKEAKEKSTPTHQAKYGSPGVFPVVHFFKKEIPVISPKAKRVTVRLASPDGNFYGTSKYSRCLSNEALSEVRNGHESDFRETSTSTRSVLDALKEISRKRIHTSTGFESSQESTKRQRVDCINDVYENNKRAREESPLQEPNSVTTTIKSSPSQSAPKKICVVDVLAASYTSSNLLKEQLEKGLKRKTELEENQKSKLKEIKLINVETQTQENVENKSELTKQLQEVYAVGKLKELEAPSSEKKVARAQNSSSRYVNIFDEKRLEINRKNKLATLLSAITGEPPQLIPHESLPKQQKEDLKLISILSPQNKPKHDKHVSFNLPPEKKEEVAMEKSMSDVSETKSISSFTSKSSSSIAENSSVQATSSVPNPVTSLVGGFALKPQESVNAAVISTSASIAVTTSPSKPTGGFKFDLSKTPATSFGVTQNKFVSPTSQAVSKPFGDGSKLTETNNFGSPAFGGGQTSSSLANAVTSSPVLLPVMSALGSSTSTATDTSPYSFTNSVNFAGKPTMFPTTALSTSTVSFPVITSAPKFVSPTTTSSPLFGANGTSTITFGTKPSTTSPFNFGGNTSTAASNFGTTSTAASNFGITSTSASNFGTTSTATSNFGTTSSSASNFGTMATSVAPLKFGSTTAPAPNFGTTTTPTTMFGAKSNNSAPIFGGVTTTTSTPIFGGVTTTTSTPIFGGVTTTTSSPIFGGITTTTSTPMFGVTTTTSVPMFGASVPTNTSTSAFGTTTSTPTPMFGTAISTSTPMFGTTMSTSTPMFGTTTSTSTPTFGTTTSTPTPMFGTTIMSTSAPMFGTTTITSTPKFGATSSAPMFGGAVTSTSTPSFGTTTISAFNNVPNFTSGFNSPGNFNAPTTTAPLTSAATFTNSTVNFGTPATSFGGSDTMFSAPTSTGGTTKPAFGYPSNPSLAFRTNLTTSAPTFGTNQITSASSSFPPNTSAPSFGTNSAPAFGGTNPATTAPPSFGTPAPPAFGSNSVTSTSTPMLGNFGSNTNVGFGTTPAFNSGAAPSFGTPVTTSSAGFPTSKSFSFGSNPTTSFNFTPKTSTSIFNTPKAATSFATNFGASSNQNVNFGPSTLQQTSAPPPPPSNPFGAAPNAFPFQAAQGNFANKTPAFNNNSFGGNNTSGFGSGEPQNVGFGSPNNTTAFQFNNANNAANNTSGGAGLFTFGSNNQSGGTPGSGVFTFGSGDTPNFNFSASSPAAFGGAPPNFGNNFGPSPAGMFSIGSGTSTTNRSRTQFKVKRRN